MAQHPRPSPRTAHDMNYIDLDHERVLARTCCVPIKVHLISTQYLTPASEEHKVHVCTYQQMYCNSTVGNLSVSPILLDQSMAPCTYGEESHSLCVCKPAAYPRLRATNSGTEALTTFSMFNHLSITICLGIYFPDQSLSSDSGNAWQSTV